MMKSVLQLNQLGKKRGGFRLGPLQLEVPKGYVTAIIGPNGAGKTTLLELCAGLSQADEGSISYNGQLVHGQMKTLPNEAKLIQSKSKLLQRKQKRVQNEANQWKQELGFVGENIYFHDDFRMSEAIYWLSNMYSGLEADYIDKLIKKLEIELDKKIKQLSKGEKMRANLLFALMHQPKLLLLDEPTEGLDPIVRAQMIELLRQIMLDEQKTIIISSHIMGELEQLADYIIFLIEGQVILYEPKDKLLEEWFLVSSPKEEKMPPSLHVIGLQEQAGILRGLISASEEKHVVDKSMLSRPSLDDLLIHFVKELRQNDQISFI